MDTQMAFTLTKLGAVATLGLAAVGSALGCGTAGMAAIGAWKKAYLKGKNALFTLLIFVGAPIAQTIYGMLLMLFILGKINPEGGADPTGAMWAAYLGVGIFGGIGMLASAWYVGKSAANACNALGETGKGLVNYLMVLGVGETVALFVMVFSMLLVS
ncbi:MAG: V-type ATP synthase subunit K [Hallerella sp.]|uniref:V-type ATP synthase subunit K n=1 Tax=Hallerella sp. TaxID=2815812 RepID=UPI00258EDD5E|nr:V-type ATP synthase subunit K [Hallerella sp.]MCI5600450.1 V-type ATP synthase subunit K [Hallerella sp.]